jgi:DNA-binding IclR family transcriptional regulator
MKETFISSEVTPKPYAGAQSVHRAIALLRSVAKYNEKGGANLSKLAREVGLHVATAHRLLTALTSEGLITHDPFSKVYHLGIELFSLGSAAYQFSIRDRYRNVIEQISQNTGDTVFLLIRSGNDVMCIDRVEGKFPIRTMTIDIGARRPLGIGAGSLSLIAFLPDEQFENIVIANERRYPRYKDLTADHIRRLAKKARRLGYVVSKGLFHEEATSVGVPVFDKHGEVIAAITVSAINQRMGSDRRDRISSLVKEISSQHN